MKFDCVVGRSVVYWSFRALIDQFELILFEFDYEKHVSQFLFF